MDGDAFTPRAAALVSPVAGLAMRDALDVLPAVVVLPGLDGTGDLLDAFRAAAPPGVECVVIGYPTGELLDYDALESYVASRLPLDRKMILVGESFSGPIAVRLAERLSERITALVLCSSFVTPPRCSLLRFVARAPLFRIRAPERVLAALMVAPFATPEVMSALSATLRKVAPAVLAHRVRELLIVNEVAALRRVCVPIVYLRGTFDRLVPERALSRIVSAAPSVIVHDIEAPHALLQTAPAAAWAAIASLMEPPDGIAGALAVVKSASSQP
jgi:pimeloyl-ACP methyl ester carboxylesterase